MIIITIKTHSNDNDNIDNNNNNTLNNDHLNNDKNDNNHHHHLLVTLSTVLSDLFGLQFHVSRFVFFVKDLDLAVDSTIKRVSKERSICCAKLRTVAKIHHIWIRCWRPGGIGEGGKGMTGARLNGSEFFFAFLGSFPLKKQKEIMVPIENLRVNKIMNGFWLIRSEKKVFVSKRGSMLAAFGRKRYRNLWCPRRGVKPLIFWWKKWHDMLLLKRPQESSSRTIHFCNK